MTHVRPRGRSAAGAIRSPKAARAVAGVAALVAAVGGASWIAITASGTPRWLELPAGAGPSWIDGPLQTLAGSAGTLSAGRLSAGLIVLVGAYLVALACAESISLRLALGAVVLANLAFMLAPTILSTDVFGYIAYAREAARHGLNPYVLPPSALMHDSVLQFVYWKHEATPYGPVFTILSLPLGLTSAAAALWTYKVAAGAASIAIAFLTADAARRRRLHPVRTTLFVGLNPVLLFYAVSGAHNDLLAMLLVLVAITLAVRERDGAAAAAAVAAAAIKITLGLALPFVLIARRRGRAVRGTALATLVIGSLTLLVFGPHVFDQLHRITTDARFDTRFSGPDELAGALGTHITPILRTLCTLAAGAVAVMAVIRAWRGADPIAAGGWAFVALLASIASLAPWYLVWLLPLAALGRSVPLRAVALAATLYLIAVHLPAFGGQPWIAGPDRPSYPAAGRLKRTLVPTAVSPSQMRPPWASTMARETASPSPAPALVRAASAPPR